MTAVEPTRERVRAHEAGQGCERFLDVCKTHRANGWWHDDDLGCPVAVAAARVEAERTAHLVEGLWKDASRRWERRALEAEAERDALRAGVVMSNETEAELIRAAKAQALREAATDLAGRTEGVDRKGTASWPEAHRDIYSLAVEEAATHLWVRADEIEATS